MLRKSIILGFIFILICFYSARIDSADCPYCCKRQAALEDFINKHNPDFDEKQDEWMKCINSRLKGWSTLNPDDPKVKKAYADCKHLEPESWEYMYPSSVRSRLVQTFTTEYFHMVHPDFIKKKPEYVFTGSYEAGLNEKSDIDGQPVTSRFILELYYNGNPREHIRTWVTEKKIKNPIPAHFRSMFTNSDAKTRPDRPIHELLWDFEKIPVTCTISPEKDPVKPDEEISIDLTSFRDRKGQASRESNRIAVWAKNGRILNGEGCRSNPDFRIFTLKKGTIKVQYKAPDSCEETEDVIHVFNSCDILDTDSIPLSETQIKDKISEKVIQLDCGGGWSGTVTYTRSVNEKSTAQGPGGATVTIHEIINENAHFQIRGWTFTHTYDDLVGIDVYYEGDEGSVTGNYSGTYKKTTTIQREGDTVVATDTARCQSIIKDGGYLVINNEEMKAYLCVGVSGDDNCSGQTTFSDRGGSYTIDFDWDQYLSMEGSDSLESTISTKNPRTVSGTFQIPEWGITWTWNLTKTGK